MFFYDMKKTIAYIICLLALINIRAQTIEMVCVADASVRYSDECSDWQTTNYGNLTKIQVAEWIYDDINCGNGKSNALLKFALDLPEDHRMLYDNRATLNLFFPTDDLETHTFTGGATDNQFYVKQITEYWGEMTVNWSNQPDATNTDRILVPSSLSNPSTQSYSIDVSGIVHNWICDLGPNYGFKLELRNQSPSRRLTFASKEFNDISKHPNLKLGFAHITAVAPSTFSDNFGLTCILSNSTNPSNYTFQWTHLNTGTIYNSQNVANPVSISGFNTYVVNVTNPWCQFATDTVVVFKEMDLSDFPVIIPNAITPNGDGKNDEWIIENIEYYPDAIINVYNKWGQLVYSGRGNHKPWDGTYKGRILPPGSYMYSIKISDTEAYMDIITIIY